MPDASRRPVARPLDVESARARADQIAALADPIHLRVLSAIAAAPDGTRSSRGVAATVEIDSDAVESALWTLRAAALLTVDERGHHQLTADAWVRFGRLLTDHHDGGVPRTTSDVSPESLADIPPVVKVIARDLGYRFSSHFSPETVERYVAESYTLLAERANITQFLPSLTTRFATDRLSALATARGVVLRGTPEVLFVCVQNAGRSQMAAAILRHLAGESVHVRTAGSSPAVVVQAGVVESLDEIGVPLAAEFPKPLTDEVVQAADYVVTMGCGDACPVYPGRRYMDWAIDDPVGLPVEDVRRIRDDIFERVSRLMNEMGLASP